MSNPKRGGRISRPGDPVNHGRFNLVMDPALAPRPAADQVSVVLDVGSFVIAMSDAMGLVHRPNTSYYPRWYNEGEDKPFTRPGSLETSLDLTLTDEQAAKLAELLAMPPLLSVEELREQAGLPPFPDEGSVVSARIDDVARQVIQDARLSSQGTPCPSRPTRSR